MVRTNYLPVVSFAYNMQSMVQKIGAVTVVIMMKQTVYARTDVRKHNENQIVSSIFHLKVYIKGT